MLCLVRDSGVWPPLYFIGTLVSHKARLMKCGLVRTGEPVSAIITVYLRPMSK